MRNTVITLCGLTTVCLVGTARAAKGPNSSADSYLVPVAAGVAATSILTAGDTVNGYKMVGVPDGIGAYATGSDSFRMFVNHELGATNGAVRAHGGTGALVSDWSIVSTPGPDFLSVTSGSDLIKSVYLNGQTATPTAGVTFARFCSGDLASPSAYSANGSGTTNRIYMNGEESGTEGRAIAHVATGPDAGKSYELPRLGKFSWENSVADPLAQNKTVVFGTDDATIGGNVYLYVGNKQTAGTDVERAGLTNGNLFGIKVSGVNVESRATGLSTAASGPVVTSGRFNLTPYDTATTTGTGAALDAASNAIDAITGQSKDTSFLRPEDASWDPSKPNDLYFVTTDRYDQVKDNAGPTIGRSRLWRMRFDDVTNPDAGGRIEMLLDGSENVGGSGNMLDNIAVVPGADGITRVMMVEDVGGNNHNGKVLMYDTSTDGLQIIAKHDPTLFGDIGDTVTAGELTRDEEFSGIIDAQSILGPGWFLLDDQAHYGISGEVVEGGQLIAMYAPQAIPEPATLGLAGVGGLALLRRRRR